MFCGKMEGPLFGERMEDGGTGVQNFRPNSFPQFPLVCFVKWGEVGRSLSMSFMVVFIVNFMANSKTHEFHCL